MTDENLRVLIIGRTNVGKTTFFSRLSELPALTSREEHTTRDTREATVHWNKKTFTVVDTGGFDITKTHAYGDEVSEKIKQELKRANLILLMTDMLDPLPLDEQHWLKRLSKKQIPLLIVLNKQDKPTMRRDAHDRSYKGIPVYAVSSKNGGGIGDLLDVIIQYSHDDFVPSVTPHGFRLGLIGRTNVGKSSLLNAFAGQARAIVSDQDHTTREPITVTVPYESLQIEIIDTAGAQKNPKEEISRKATALTRQAIETCDVIGVVLEYGMNPVPSQDLELAQYAENLHKSICIIINKWDSAQERSHDAAKKELKRIRQAFSHFPYAPIILTSATQRIHVHDVLKKSAEVFQERFVKLDKTTLRGIVASLSEHIFQLKQLEIDPPRFHAIGTSRTIPRAMTDILHKRIRSAHLYEGTPIIVSLAKRSRRNESRSRTR